MTALQPDQLELLFERVNGLHLLGERFIPSMKHVDVPFESAFLIAGRAIPSESELEACVPDLQIFFDGFCHLQSDPQLYLSLGNSNEPPRNIDFALFGVGILLLQPSMFGRAEDSLHEKKWTPKLQELKLLANLLEQMTRLRWGVKGKALAVRFADKDDPNGFMIASDHVQMCFQLTAEVDKEVYLSRLEILGKELEHANRHVVMSSLSGAMGKETLQ